MAYRTSLPTPATPTAPADGEGSNVSALREIRELVRALRADLDDILAAYRAAAREHANIRRFRPTRSAWDLGMPRIDQRAPREDAP